MVVMDAGISLIIPCRNEAGTIELVIEKGALLPGVAEIIVVEGNSNDKTHQVAQENLNKLPASISWLLLKQKNKGKWDAVILGIEKSKNQYISIWDADLTVSPIEQQLIHQKFLEQLSKSNNVFATGNRMANREPGAMKFFNVLGNYFFAYLWSFTAKQRVNDSLCGSKIFQKNNLENLPQHIKKLDPYGDFSIIASSLISDATIISIPVTYRARTYGQTNIARWRGGLSLLRVWIKLHNLISKKRKHHG